MDLIWKIIISVLAGIILSVGGWTSQRVATISERHPTRIEFKKMQDTIQCNQEKLEYKIDKIMDHLLKKGG